MLNCKIQSANIERSILMKKTYAIEVDCANCANLMETAAGKVDGVKNATVNFMTQKMIVEFEAGGRARRSNEGSLESLQKRWSRIVR